MASAHHDENERLPITWPFRAAGTVMVLATIWFCTGWAIRDLGPEERLAGHMPVFYAGIVLAFALCVFGGIINTVRERRRLQLLNHEA